MRTDFAGRAAANVEPAENFQNLAGSSILPVPYCLARDRPAGRMRLGDCFRLRRIPTAAVVRPIQRIRFLPACSSQLCRVTVDLQEVVILDFRPLVICLAGFLQSHFLAANLVLIPSRNHPRPISVRFLALGLFDPFVALPFVASPLLFLPSLAAA